MEKLLAIIPARGGSKGIPGKNIKMLGDKHLIGYTIETALAYGQFDEVLVSTEDEQIAQIAISYGASVPFMRPEELASDESPTVDALVDTLQKLTRMGRLYEAVCLLQPTVPFRSVETISQAIEKFEQSDADSLVSVREVPHAFNPHWAFEENEKGQLSVATGDKTLITRRQDLPKAYFRDGSIYLTKAQVIIDHSLYGAKISYLLNEADPDINIDTVSDWERAEKYLNK